MEERRIFVRGVCELALLAFELGVLDSLIMLFE